MATVTYPRGTIVRCQESVHTPAFLALLDPAVSMTPPTFPTVQSLETYDGQKTRPCVIMPTWGSEVDGGEVKVCVMGTFDKVQFRELAEVHQHFVLPMYKHSQYPSDHRRYAVANVKWTTDAWLVAYPFVPLKPLLDPWMERGRPAELMEKALEQVSRECDLLRV
ncbi:hypothetical protein BV25DRAFT_896371 [Artomyces pyxidatus]|uniref:Uncharacterized protein n=1 Tax=Artomyces pyxidatus TaxID=48021 RepID=A0ACB8SW05_9AGAM|nr:hypothetical protein BV25DRAFT_896371 [Artomyces pyxidatus]